MSLCWDDERPPLSFLTVAGTAEISEDPAEMLRWATRIGGRYLGADRAEEYGRRNAVPPEMVVRVTPARIAPRSTSLAGQQLAYGSVRDSLPALRAL